MPKASDGPISRAEVITSVQRRRRWSTAEKVRLVEEAMQPGMSVSFVARQAGVDHPRFGGHAGVARHALLGMLGRYARPGMLFSLDPPYYGSEGDYGREAFGRDQFARLAQALRSLKGRFLLSINDRPEIREIFAGLPMETVETTYTFANKVAPMRGAS